MADLTPAAEVTVSTSSRAPQAPRVEGRAEAVRWRTELARFLKEGGMALTIPYSGPELNPRRFWHWIVVGSRTWPRFLFQMLVIGLTTPLPASALKNGLLRLIGMRIGKEAFVAAGVVFDLEFPELVSIGDGAIIGTRTKVLTHEVTIRGIRVGRVVIGRQALVGVGCVVRCGTRIGDGAVVSMNSYVNHDVADRELAGGNPLKTIRQEAGPL